MRYGTLPLVRKTGGLADTVTDGKTGFVFGPYTSTALTKKMEEAIRLYTENPGQFATMIRAVMRQDFSWATSAKKYRDLYQKLTKT